MYNFSFYWVVFIIIIQFINFGMVLENIGKEKTVKFTFFSLFLSILLMTGSGFSLYFWPE